MLLSRTDSSSNQLVRMQFRALVDVCLISAVRHIGAALVGKNLCVHTTDLRFMPITDASNGNFFFVVGYLNKYLT